MYTFSICQYFQLGEVLNLHSAMRAVALVLSVIGCHTHCLPNPVSSALASSAPTACGRTQDLPMISTPVFPHQPPPPSHNSPMRNRSCCKTHLNDANSYRPFPALWSCWLQSRRREVRDPLHVSLLCPFLHDDRCEASAGKGGD